MDVSWENVRGDAELFWIHRLKRGKVAPPEPAYVSIEEKYDPYAIKNIFREFKGRHRCPACERPYFFIWSAWNCHPKASAYKIWGEFAHRGPAGCASLSDLIAADIGANHYGAGGPFGF